MLRNNVFYFMQYIINDTWLNGSKKLFILFEKELLCMMKVVKC